MSVAVTILKADDDPHLSARDQFKQLLADESIPMRAAFSRFVDSMLEDISDAQIRTWVENRDLQGFLSAAADHIDEMSDVLPNSFIRAARAEIEDLAQPGRFGLGKLSVEFDPGASSAVDLMESSRLQFIRDFTASQKDSVSSAISDALASGEGPAAAARRFRSAIGLTENQYEAVQSYQRLLENTSKSALDRALRDGRFDRTIERAIENDDVLSAKQIEKMVGRYTENMRGYRAMTIARTEMMRSINSAKQEAWRQIAEQLGIDLDRVEKTWITTLDGNERDTHHDMNRQTVKGLDEPFVSPSGAELVYPGDPSAPAEETIQCRCTVVVRFPPPPRQLVKVFNPGEARDAIGRWTVGASTTITHAPTGARAKITNTGVEGRVVVGSVETPKEHRGKGGADRVMAVVEDHLDEHHYEATLVPAPQDQTTTHDRLRSLYERHGFKVSRNGISMERRRR